MVIIIIIIISIILKYYLEESFWQLSNGQQLERWRKNKLNFIFRSHQLFFIIPLFQIRVGRILHPHHLEGIIDVFDIYIYETFLRFSSYAYVSEISSTRNLEKKNFYLVPRIVCLYFYLITSALYSGRDGSRSGSNNLSIKYEGERKWCIEGITPASCIPQTIEHNTIKPRTVREEIYNCECSGTL